MMAVLFFCFFDSHHYYYVLRLYVDEKLLSYVAFVNMQHAFENQIRVVNVDHVGIVGEHAA